MNRTKLTLLAMLALGVVSAYAAPTIYGNLIQLDRQPTGSIPAPSAANVGSLIYDTTLGQPVFSDGGTWAPLGGGGGGGGISGSGTANKVTYWNAASSVTSDNDFSWDPTNNRLGVGAATPGFQVDLGSNLADTKLAIYNDGVGQLGFGVQASQFRFHVDASPTEFRWGVGSGFVTPIMTLTPTGDLSITDDFAATGDIRAGTSTFFADVAGGHVGVGMVTPTLQFQVSQSGTATADRGVWVTQHNDNIHGAALGFRKSRGTITAPTTVVSGDYGGFNPFMMHDGTNYLITGGFGARAMGTITTGSVPTDIFFWTSGGPDDGDPYTNGTVRMVIDATGDVGIGSTTPTSKLHIVSPAATATLANGIRLTNATQTIGIVVANDGTSYIGTTDSSDFNIRTNDTGRVNVDASTGNVCVGCTAGATNLLEVNGIAAANTVITTAANSTGITFTAKNSATINFGSIAAGTCEDQTMTLTGSATGDDLSCSWPAGLEANLASHCRVSAANTVTFRLCNVQTLGAIDPASGTFGARAFR